MEDSFYLFHGNQSLVSLVTKCKQMDFHGFMVSLVSWFHGTQWSIHHFKCLSFKDRAVQILAFCHWQRSSLSHQTSSLLWQVSIQNEAHLHPNRN